MFAAYTRLRKQGVLGLNQRNVHFISQYNARHLFPLVDDKLKTKLLAREAHVNAPHLIEIIKYQHETRHLEDFLKDLREFVIKPSKGSSGKGILVIVDRHEDGFVKSSGETVSLQDIRRHVSNILGGLFSLAGKPDIVILEDLIHSDPVFLAYSYEGVPDIRFIVFQGFPILAMMRLATHRSDGKANLHQGAIGVGLDLANGKAVSAVQFDRPIEIHPDTGVILADLHIPSWKDMVVLAARCYDITKLGYLGADIVLDAKHGPLLLELNARPGLAIQIANKTGLLNRLYHIEDGKAPNGFTAEQRADYAINRLSCL